MLRGRRTSGGKNVLHCAAANGANESLEFLLRKPFDFDARDNAGWTPLHFAAKNGSMKCIKLLIKAGANINSSCPSWKKELLYEDKIRVVDISFISCSLLITKPDTECIQSVEMKWNNSNMCPSQTAAEEKHFDCYKYLVEEETRWSSEVGAAEKQMMSAVGRIGQQTYTIIHHLASVNFSQNDVETMIDDSKYGDEIIQGSFGTAIKVTKPENWRAEVVVKKIQVKFDEMTEAAKLELCGRRVVHPCILPLIVAFQAKQEESPEPSSPTFYFISPFCENGDLRTLIKKKTDFNQVRRIRTALHVASAIVYLHTSVPGESYKFLHKHISSANIVLDASWNARLIDFGHAIRSDESDKEHEYYSCNKGGEPSKEWDYFAFGVILRELLTGSHPVVKDGRYLKDFNKEDSINNVQKEIFQNDGIIEQFNDMAELCIAKSKGLNFKKAVKNELKTILLGSQIEIVSRKQDKDMSKCDLCMINPAACFGADIEQRNPHKEVCLQPIRVCVSCHQISFRNPIKCFSCGSNIGPHWGALLIAGDDSMDNEATNAFIEDIRILERVIPSVFGMKKLNIEVVISEECTDPISDFKSALNKIEEQEIRTLLIYYSGHGTTGNDSNNSDQANSFKFGSKHMSLEEFQFELGKLSKVETFVIILDRCCAPEVRLEKKSVLQINSCQQDQSSYTVKDGSPFTKYFVQALQLSSENSKCLLLDCDVCKDYRQKSSTEQNFISVDFLYRYIRDHMRKSQSFFRQTPTLFLRGETTRLQIFTIKQIIDFRARNMNEFNIRAGQLGLHLTGRTTLNEDGALQTTKIRERET